MNYSKLKTLSISLFVSMFVTCSTIEPTPVKVSADFNTDITDIIVGQSISFSDASTGEPTSWDWEFEGGSPSFSTSQNPTITYNKPGSFDVTLTVSSASSDDVKIRTVIINVKDKVEAAFSGNKTTLAEGESVTYTDESVGEVTSWNWTFENGTPSTSTEQNPTILYNVVGQHTVTLKVADNLSESTEVKTGYIQVNSPFADIEIFNPSISSTTITQGEPFTVAFEIKNIGELGITETFVTHFYYSDNSVSNELLGLTETQNLNAGETKVVFVDLVIPAYFSGGAGQITGWVDPNTNLNEENVDNNISIIDITVVAGTSTSSTPDLDGIWESASGNVVYEIIDGSGYYKEILGGSTLQGQNDGVISVGDLKMKNMSLRYETTDTYDGDWLWLVGTTSQGYTHTEWSDPSTTTFILRSADELYVTSSHTKADGSISTGSGTYTRRN